MTKPQYNTHSGSQAPLPFYLRRYARMDNISAQRAAGFTIVEMAIALVIIGSILAIGTALIPRLAFQFQKDGTYDRMQIVHKALSSYAQKHHRIPCPAEPVPTIVTQPYGTERGSGGNGQNIGICTTNQARHGIIPFRTLGLSYDDALDSFGNLFTYRVSRTPTVAPNPAAGTDFINNWCRTVPKWRNTGGGNDLDPEKAAFCCGHLPSNAIAAWINQDTNVQSAFGPLPNSTRNIVNYGGALAEYSQNGAAAPNQVTLRDRFRPSFAAYTLISHGPNGVGSYDVTGTSRPGAFLSLREQDNANSNLNTTYVQDNSEDAPNAGDPGVGVKQPLNLSQIDDIVSWRSPFQTYGAVGNASCLEARQ